MIWHDILATITKLVALDELTVDACASALDCKFERTTSNRYRSDALREPFEYAELILGSDKTMLVLTLQANTAREEYAMRMKGLGKPIDMSIVSPPIADEHSSSTNLGWERKFSLCYEIGERPVWFGIEEENSRKKLVSVSIDQHP